LCSVEDLISELLILDGCIVWNAHNTVFGSKHSAISNHAVDVSFNVFCKLNDLHISTACVIMDMSHYSIVKNGRSQR